MKIDREISRLTDLVHERAAPVVPSEEGPVAEPAEKPPSGPAGTATFEPFLDDVAIEERVRKVIDKRARKAVERERSETARRQRDQMNQWLARWTKELDLNERQQEELRDNYARRLKAIAAHQERLRELGDRITPQEREILQQANADAARVLDDELKKSLSTTQYEKLMDYYKNRGRKGRK